jgi:hypothetical protein
MEDIKNSVASRWQKQPPLKTTFTSAKGLSFTFMLSQPIPLYLKQAFELLCFTHPYVDPFDHVYYLPLFSIMLLSDGIYLWKLSMITKSLSCWAYSFCYISSILKRLHSKERIVCSLFSDQELRFAITNYSLPYASLFVILFYLLQVYII